MFFFFSLFYFIPLIHATLTSFILSLYITSVKDSMKALLDMRRNAKEKELEALLSGDRDSCSCFIEVILVS